MLISHPLNQELITYSSHVINSNISYGSCDIIYLFGLSSMIRILELSATKDYHEEELFKLLLLSSSFVTIVLSN